MGRSTSILTSLAVACLMSTACDAPTPTAIDDVPPSFAKASTVTSNVTIPLDLDVYVPCAAGGAGEPVHLSGNLHLLNHFTGNGMTTTVVTHAQPQGVVGIGLITGDMYRGTGVTQDASTYSFLNGHYSTAYVNNFDIIGQGRGNNATLHHTIHMTFNANGVATASADDYRVECK